MNSITIVERLFTASIETAIAAVIAGAIALLIGRRAPRLVALLWLVVMIKPLITLTGISLVRFELPVGASIPQSETVAVDVVRTFDQHSTTPVEQARRHRSTQDLIAAAWLAGIALMAARTLTQRLRLHSIVRASHEASPRLAHAYAAAAHNRAPRLRVSDTLDGPAIAGAFRPTILIPSWMETQADDAQLAWTLRHELRHAAARDTLAIALRELALIVFWFHPAVWIAAHCWEGATELACDRDVVRDDADAVGYAEALMRTLMHVRQQRRVQFAGLFATRSKIGTRVAALVERPLAPKVGRTATVGTLLVALALLGAGSTLAETHHRTVLLGAGRSDEHSRGEIEGTDDDRSFSLRFDGEITTSPLSITPGGYLYFRETIKNVTRELRLEGTSSGIERTYHVNRKQQPADESFEKHALDEYKRVMKRGND